MNWEGMVMFLRKIFVWIIALFSLLPVMSRAEPDLSSLVSLLESTPEGEWARANINKFQDVWTPPELRPLAYNSNPPPEKIISAWGGFAWDSKRGDLIIYGGGHGNYAGNDVYRWRGTTRTWERASLPSQVTVDTANQDVTVDGPDHAPVSAHTYDNNVYLPIFDRFMTFGGAKFEKSGPYTRDRGDGTVRPTGPYLFDPSRADANRVGGLTGSHVMRVAPYPEIEGGGMWQNRDIYGNLAISSMSPSSFIDGATAVTAEGGVDVVYVNAPVNQGSTQNLYKYTLTSLNDPVMDRWERVGVEFDAFNGQGAGALDQKLNLFVRTSGATFTYWDLNTAGLNNRNRNFKPAAIGEPFTLTTAYGIDYDISRDQYLLWAGGSSVWALKSPGYASPTGWTITKQPLPVLPVPSTSIGSGVLGKWKYVQQLDAFVGLVDSYDGNVWLYKPVGWKSPLTGDGGNPSPPRIVSTTLNSAVTGNYYSATLAASGGVPPYTWTLAGGTLPEGLTLDPTGQLSGVPLLAGSYFMTVQVMAQGGVTATGELSLVVHEPSAALFEDDFSDGTFAPWSQLKSGQIALIDDPIDGWVLRKRNADDPHGGYAPLGRSVGDFELVLYTRKVNTAGGSWNRYSVTDVNGNGYGIYLSYDTGELGVERRDNWTAVVKRVASGSLAGGMKLGQWYTLRLARQGSQLTAEVFDGDVEPAISRPLLQVTMADSRHGGLTQVNINGGRDFDTAYVRVVDQPLTLPPGVTSSTLADAIVSHPYLQTLGASGGVAPYYWSLVGGALPEGIMLDATGQLSGTPLLAGNYLIHVQVMDQSGVTATRELVLIVQNPAAVLFEDDFSDGTLAPWSQLKSGQVSLVDDPVDGWVLRKSSADDPNGGWAPLASTVNDFELMLYTRKVNTAGGGWSRYSVTDSNGNGYGLYWSYSTGQLGVERRDNWSSIVNRTAPDSLAGGVQLGQWYTVKLIRRGSQVTAEVYEGRTDPTTTMPALQATMVDATHTGLTQVNINGGRDFDTAGVVILP